MRNDVIVVGTELDGLIAALRLTEAGYSVRIFIRGGGALHYAPGGIHFLGYRSESDNELVDIPVQSIAQLNSKHPYRLLGQEKVSQALEWFLTTSAAMDLRFTPKENNQKTLTPAGNGLPVFAPYQAQAILDTLRGKKLAVVRFSGHRDYMPLLITRGLREMGASVTLVDLEPPGGQAETVSMARALDRFSDPGTFFREVARRLPAGVEIALFPAMLGFEAHPRIMDASTALDCLCLEVPTLPPSVPGMRLLRALERRLLQELVPVHHVAGITASRSQGDRGWSLLDEHGHSYDSTAFVLANGGILMGGLAVDSYGRVHEPTLGLDVYQTAPLDADRVDRALDALHRAGIEVDASLRPQSNGVAHDGNLFVTGAMLAHWNPMQEASSEGVSIATGWAAAEAVQAYLAGR